MNKDKVIKGLECCTFILGKRKCNECPYQKDNGCYQLQDDFHTLLKEQEAVKPKIDAFGHPYCPKCKILVYETWEFCPHCGREMKWNE